MTRFEGKTVFVTGAGLGIGLEMCRQFAREGATVALNDLDAQVAQSGAQNINIEVGRDAVLPYVFDVADVRAIRHNVQAFAHQTGRLDVMIANAGITNYGEFLDYTPEAFDRLTGVNMRGSFFAAQAAARIMLDRHMQGTILFTASVTGLRTIRNLHAYGATKAAIIHLAATLAYELGPHGINVNAVVPGAIVTERTLLDDPKFAENWGGVTPLRRAGYPRDIAAAALFLASPEGQYINGQAIVVDGGWSVQSPIPAEHPDKPEFSSQLR